MSDKIEQAAIRWIKADYLFRLGPYAYGPETTEELLLAEDNLRLAVTGSPGLGMAALDKKIGIDMEKLERLYRARRASGAKTGVIGSSDPYENPPINPRYARLLEDGKGKNKSVVTTKAPVTKTVKRRVVRRVKR